MATISELRIQFDKMSTEQKKQFVLNLKSKVESSGNPEHKKFLNECIQKYNDELRSGQRRADTGKAASSKAAADEDDDDDDYYQVGSPLKKILIAAAALIVVAVIGILVLPGILSKSKDDAGTPSDSPSAVTATNSDTAHQGGAPVPGDSDSASPEGGGFDFVSYTYGRDFSDGVAWVYSGDRWACIDTAGNVLFKLDSGDFPDGDFYYGAACVSKNGVNELVDKSGRTVSSPSIGDYDNILYYYEQSEFVSVEKEISTYELSETRYGIINTSGEYQVGLTADEIVEDVVDGYHIGDGVFSMGLYGTDYYNVYTGESYTYEKGSLFNSDLFPQYFEDGYSVFIDEGRVCSITDRFEVTELFLCDEEITSPNQYLQFCVAIGPYKEGLFFYSDYYDDMSRGRNQGFYDIDGNQVIDLSAFEIQPESMHYMEFSDGYCQLLLLNPQGDTFYTIIDKEGNVLFDPRPAGGSYYQLSCERLVEVGKVVYDAATGDEVFRARDNETISAFCEGLAMVTRTSYVSNPDNGVYYIDIHGNRVL